ncbi:zinc ribbon domain-containing protein [Chloroflexota bacterium]
MRNTKREYLLRGHVKCRQCGHAYVGGATRRRADGSYRRLYRCLGKWKDRVATELCCNKSWRADKLEAMVWNELEKQRQGANQQGVFEIELQKVERQLKAVDREQHQLLQWALKGFPESQVEAENLRLNKARGTFKTRKTEFETQLKASQDAIISIPKLESFIDRMQRRIAELDFEGKRQVLDMLGITVWLDGEAVEVTGTIDTEDVTVNMLSQ